MTHLRFVDVLYFLAELAVYVAVVWFGFTRAAPAPGRWGLAVGGLAVFAVSWAIFASPKAAVPLSGAVDVAFRVVWFGLGLTAAVLIITGAVRTH